VKSEDFFKESNSEIRARSNTLSSEIDFIKDSSLNSFNQVYSAEQTPVPRSQNKGLILNSKYDSELTKSPFK